MLGGKAPKVDEGIVTTWMTKDWEEEYPGPNNARCARNSQSIFPPCWSSAPTIARPSS